RTSTRCGLRSPLIGESMNRSLAFPSILRVAVAALAWLAVLALAAPAAAQPSVPPPAAADGGAEPSDEEPPPSRATEASPDAGSPPIEPSAVPPADEAANEAESAVTWAGRDSEINESNTITGGVGLLRTQHAESGAPGQFRIGFVGEWFSANFLCTSKFPCAQRLITGDTMNHIGGTLSLGVSIAKLGAGTLEAYA